MASFLDVLKKIGKGAAIAANVAQNPLLGLIPGVAPVQAAISAGANLVTVIQGSVVKAEAEHPADGTGPTKAAQVLSDFDEWFSASADLANQALAARGERLTYDAALVQAASDAFVDAYNKAAAAQKSIKVVPLT